MSLCVIKFLIIISCFTIQYSNSTIDINLAEYQYIADHLTEKECHQLVAALHFHSFELPKDINAAERRLPENVPCIDLLLHWNSTPKEGRGETHVEVCHRLNQIGREDLAEWLSKTVFHQLSQDLKIAFTTTQAEEKTTSPIDLTEIYQNDEIPDESAWWKIDSLLEILIVFGLITLILGSFFLCFLCCSRGTAETRQGYTKLPRNEN